MPGTWDVVREWLPRLRESVGDTDAARRKRQLRREFLEGRERRRLFGPVPGDGPGPPTAGPPPEEDEVDDALIARLAERLLPLLLEALTGDVAALVDAALRRARNG